MGNTKQILSHQAGSIAVLIFAVLTIWRVVLLFVTAGESTVFNTAVVWGASYQLMALWGVLCGFWYMRQWGGWRSVMGRATLMFTLGLCFQLFGQSASSVYYFFGHGVPYPSLGDIGFFGSIFFYAAGAILLGNASGARVSLHSMKGKLMALLVPLLLLTISFAMFLRGYAFDWSQPLIIFLDFGYPLGQAFYVSMAILAYLLSLKMLGGVMKVPALSFIVALVAQYIADFTFIYQSHAGTYIAGGIADYLYLTSYFLMSISLIRLGVVFNTIKRS